MSAVIEERHKLGWGLAALVVAGNMIGSGVYLLPATLAPVGSSSVVGWAVAGLGAVTLALVFAALGRLQPDADGLSGFAERGLGRFFGFQTALAFWTACLVGNVAIAVAATGYLGFFYPVLKEPVAATFCNLGLIWLTTGAYISARGRPRGSRPWPSPSAWSPSSSPWPPASRPSAARPLPPPGARRETVSSRACPLRWP